MQALLTEHLKAESKDSLAEPLGSLLRKIRDENALCIFKLCQVLEEYSSSTGSLAIALFDRLLASISRVGAGPEKDLSVYPFACLMIASKLTERRGRHLSPKALWILSGKKWAKEAIGAAEIDICDRFEFDLNLVTPFTYVTHMLQLLPPDRRRQIEEDVSVFIVMAACESEFCAYTPSIISVASMLCATQGCGMDNASKKLCQWAVKNLQMNRTVLQECRNRLISALEIHYPDAIPPPKVDIPPMPLEPLIEGSPPTSTTNKQDGRGRSRKRKREDDPGDDFVLDE